MKTLLNKVLQKKDLTRDESESLATEMLQGNLTQAQIAGVLVALAAKGESVDEVTGFVTACRLHMDTIHADNAVDVCGTGGDEKNTFNISTAVALVVAAGGVRVAKHGNSAVSSKSGSADVLRALDVCIDLQPYQAEEVLEKAGIVFLFAPLFHPAFKHVASVRKELGIRTIFNYLGPLLNPADVKKQMIGVPNRRVAEVLIQVGKDLEYEHLLVVTGEDGVDEVSISGPTYLYELKKGHITQAMHTPSQYGLKKAFLEDITGGTDQENAQIILDILSDKKSPKRDVVVLNSAFAFYVAGRVGNISQGIQLANAVLASGKANQTLQILIQETQKYA